MTNLTTVPGLGASGYRDLLPHEQMVWEAVAARGDEPERTSETEFRFACPAHHGENLNASAVTHVDGDGGISFKCYSHGCTHSGIREALGLKQVDLYPGSRADYTIHDFSRDKNLPVRWLIDQGVSTVSQGTRRVMQVRVYDENGRDISKRIRRRDNAGDKPKDTAKAGSHLRLLGMQKHTVIGEKGYVVLVEGTSDVLTLHYNNIPALGLPGASTLSNGVLEDLRRIMAFYPNATVYVCFEKDAASAGMVQSLAKTGITERVKVFDCGEFKDPSDLFCDNPDAFDERFKTYLDAAKWWAEAVTNLPEIADGPDTEDAEEKIPLLMRFDQITPKKVEWLWPLRIPIGALTIIDGDPGGGKTSVAVTIAANVTVGRPIYDFAGANAVCGNVLIMTAEDDVPRTILPRFLAAGGDTSKMFAVNEVPDEKDRSHTRPLTIPKDLSVVERLINEHGIKLVIVDTLMAFLDAGLDAHKDQEVRRALTPLARLAERTGTAFLILRHLNKGQGSSAMYRGSGSIGITGAARSVLMVAKDRDDTRKRILASVKSNLGPKPTGIRFSIVASAEYSAPKVVWEADVDVDVDDLLAPTKQTAVKVAGDFIKEYLADGPKDSQKFISDAEAAGISETSLNRARKEIGVLAVSPKTSKLPTWMVKLPDTKGNIRFQTS